MTPFAYFLRTDRTRYLLHTELCVTLGGKILGRWIFAVDVIRVKLALRIALDWALGRDAISTSNIPSEYQILPLIQKTTDPMV